MKFHLRSLLVLVTFAAIVIAITLSIVNHRKRLREHRMAFLTIGESVSALDTPLLEHVLSINSVAATLKESNPVDLQMALGQSIMGESMSVGACTFRRTFHYDWQLRDGSRCDGIRITVDAKLDENSLDDHIVRLTFKPNPLNEQVASWIGEQLAQNEHAQLEYVKQNHEPPAFEPASEEDHVESTPISAYGGVR